MVRRVAVSAQIQRKFDVVDARRLFQTEGAKDGRFSWFLSVLDGLDHLRGGRFSGIRHPGRTDSRRTHVIAPFILKCFQWKFEHLTLAAQ